MAAKELIIVGGPNGSGKTTFANEMIDVTGYAYIGADAIAAKLSPDDPARAAIDAGKEFVSCLQQALAGEDSFIVESTLSGRTLARYLEQARTAEFEIRIVFVYLDAADRCIDRVSERVQKGGHHVPDDDVRRRFCRSLSNFWDFYRVLCNEWLLVNNAGEIMHEVAGGTAEDCFVRDAELFEEFNTIAQRVMSDTLKNNSTSDTIDELMRIAQSASRKARAESRRLGVANVFWRDGILYFELPDGEITRTPPPGWPTTIIDN